MAESEEQREARVQRELEGKNIAHYQTLLSAWIDTRMERDRTLITLCSGAIGLLFTVLITVGVASRCEIPLYALALASFLGALGILLVILHKNSELIEAELRDEGHAAPDLLQYDRWASGLFVVGIVFSAAIGIIEAILRKGA